MSIKRFVAGLASAAGYTIVPNWRLSQHALAQKVAEIFRVYEIKTVIDVGANTGQYYRFLRLYVGFNGRIISYEPIPELAAKLREENSRDPLWTIHEKALGAKVETLELNVMAYSDFSSFRAPLAAGTKVQNEMNTIKRKVAVQVSTLDHELANIGELGQTFLKLDTQGFDLEALKGAGAVISRIPALQTEVAFRLLYDGMPHYAESLAAFAAHGFSVADFSLVSCDERQEAIEFDCLMVRAKKVSFYPRSEEG